MMLLLQLSLAIDPVDKNLKSCGDAWYLSSQVSIKYEVSTGTVAENIL